ncbi:MAG: 50S ribosomal protein L3 [Patescibacteria group bacterium]
MSVNGAFLFFIMIQTFFAKKIGMTSKYTTSGAQVGSTVLQVLPTRVLDMRTVERHKYNAVRLKVQDSRLKKKEFVKEVRMDETIEAGTELNVAEIVQVGDKISVSGITKGHGFAGAVKRHGFRGGPRTHGQSDRERAPGSSGSTTTPGRVYKGKRRAGHMGVDKVMIKNLKVLEVDAEKKTVTISGSVPGANRYTILTIKKLA